MKLTAAIAGAMVLAVGVATAQQKIGHVNTEAIMSKLPDAADAQRQLDVLVGEWQRELDWMQDEWKRKFEEYDQKKLIMTDARRAESERELRELDQRIAEYRNQKFGQNGELFQKQNDLMKPVQDRVFKAIQDVATEEGFDYVLDQSGEILMMYANPVYDLTQKVLARLQAATSLPKTN
ncbi:MAG: OmpH family outer membrane protein [Ignavibacterium sp.]|jgi:outer membrane protein